MDSLDALIKSLSRLPGLGPRSARRVALHLLKKKDLLMVPLGKQIMRAAEEIKTCSLCGNLSTHEPCPICTDPRRDRTKICVVQEVDDLWAMERTKAYRGLYHVTNGTLSALDGVRPEDLRLPQLIERIIQHNVTEIIIGLSATIDGQATGYYISDQLRDMPHCHVTRLAQGIPVGSELDYLDDGTLTLAFQSRQNV
jgi:recombination protein RecR